MDRSRRPDPLPRSRSPGWRSTCRSPTSTGRSTTSCPRRCTSRRSPGCRVKVRFAGRDVDGFVIARADDTDHVGRLAPMRRVVSSRAGAAPGGARPVAPVADRYAGTWPTCSGSRSRRVTPGSRRRSPSPPRPGSTSRSTRWPRPGRRTPAARPSSAGSATVSPRGRSGPRCPVRVTVTAMAAAAAATAASGRGSLLLAPDARDVARLDQALTALLGSGRHVVLTADLGPAARYRAFLAVRRGQVPIVVGTRAAAFAPVARPRAGRPVGRRRRPVRRAAGAVPARARGAAAAGARQRRRAAGRDARSVEARRWWSPAGPPR